MTSDAHCVAAVTRFPSVVTTPLTIAASKARPGITVIFPKLFTEKRRPQPGVAFFVPAGLNNIAWHAVKNNMKYRKIFITQNTMRQGSSISMKLIKGPFKKLNGKWRNQLKKAENSALEFLVENSMKKFNILMEKEHSYQEQVNHLPNLSHIIVVNHL